MSTIKKIAIGIAILSALSTIISFFSISAGLLNVAFLIIGIGLWIWGRKQAIHPIMVGVTLVNIIGIVFAALGTLGMMGNVNRECNSIDPMSSEHTSCVAKYYSPDRGLASLWF